MTVRSLIGKVFEQEGLNFLVTNRIPRRAATRFIGWFSRSENPLVRSLSIGTWRLFADLDLSEAKKTSFKSMHDCFTRELKEGARPIDRDPAVLVSPCDAIVGACGAIAGTELFQIKGSPYGLEELLRDAGLVAQYRNGRYATLRLTSSMYHRFHAPHDCKVERLTYISGDAWNVNPVALKRVPKLFCQNERAIVETRLAAGGHRITLVPVAAVLVASIRLNFLDTVAHVRDLGDTPVACNAPYAKGAEMGYFEHGSTIIVFAPDGFALSAGIAEGQTIRMGQPLMRLPGADVARNGVQAATRA
jgi:phosphatidylserine decarboxylase